MTAPQGWGYNRVIVKEENEVNKNPNIESMSPIFQVRTRNPRSGAPRSVWGDETRKEWNWNPRGKAKVKTLRSFRTGK